MNQVSLKGFVKAIPLLTIPSHLSQPLSPASKSSQAAPRCINPLRIIKTTNYRAGFGRAKTWKEPGPRPEG